VSKIKTVGSPGFVADDVQWLGPALLGHASCVGYPSIEDEPLPTKIGEGVVIGAFCIVERGAYLVMESALTTIVE
jgi:hypothetical protein